MAVHSQFLLDTLNGYLTGKTIKAALLKTGYTEADGAHYSDLTASEVTGTGYTAGGVTCAGVTVAYDATNTRCTVTVNAVNFGVVTITGVAAIAFYIDTGTTTTSDVLAVDVFDGPVDVNNTGFTYTPNTAGIAAFAIAGELV